MSTGPHRLRTARQFSAVVRNGGRAGAGLLVVHALVVGDDEESRFGLIVAKTVGAAVQRNRVKRRLRPLLTARLREVHPAQWLVVRALPAAAAATSSQLEGALDSGLRRARQSGPGMAS